MRADRLLRLLALLQRHRHLRATELAERLEVSERTVLRDMAALSAAGVPVWTEQGRTGGCHLMEGWTTDATGLTTDEAQALFSWASGVSAADLGLGADLTGALAKVAASVPEDAVSRGEALGAVVLADRRRWFTEAEAVPSLPVLRRAALDGVRVRLAYRSPDPRSRGDDGRTSVRTVDPYGLVDQSGRWYLVAAHRGQLRSYRVSRIAEVSLLSEPARRADSRPLPEIWAELRGNFEVQAPQPTTLEVRVDPSVDRSFWVIVRNQLVTDTEPVAMTHHTWQLTIRAGRAALALVLAWAPWVELVGPPALLSELHDQLRQLQKTYPAGRISPADPSSEG